jgi:hypothetical protein
MWLFLDMCGTGVWSQGLQGRCSTTWATPPPISALVILETGSFFFAQVCLNHNFLISGFCYSWDDRCFCSAEMGISGSFLQGLASNCDPHDLSLPCHKREPSVPNIKCIFTSEKNKLYLPWKCSSLILPSGKAQSPIKTEWGKESHQWNLSKYWH